MLRHPDVKHVLGKTVCSPLILPVKLCEIEFSDCVTVVFYLFALDLGVVSKDSHRLIVMREGEGKDLPIDLILSPHKTKKLNDAPYRECHTMGVLTVRHV